MNHFHELWAHHFCLLSQSCCHYAVLPLDRFIVICHVLRNIFLNKFCSEYLVIVVVIALAHDDVIKWKHFPRYWPFVRGIHRSPVNSPHKGQWRGALMFSLICVWINGWVNNREAGDLRRYRAHYYVSVMMHWFVNEIWGFWCRGVYLIWCSILFYTLQK